MSVQQTSLSTFRQLNPHELGRRQREILHTLKLLGASTDKNLGLILKRPINEITPRRNELVKFKLVQERCKVKQDGRTVILWEVVKKE